MIKVVLLRPLVTGARGYTKKHGRHVRIRTFNLEKIWAATTGDGLGRLAAFGQGHRHGGGRIFPQTGFAETGWGSYSML